MPPISSNGTLYISQNLGGTYCKYIFSGGSSGDPGENSNINCIAWMEMGVGITTYTVDSAIFVLTST